jgi:rod shape-determining protein MreD
MTRYHTLRLAGVGIVALVLEVTALDAVAWRGGRPELLLLLACFAALYSREPSQGLLAAWVLGLLKDAASASLFGWHALLFLAVAVAMSRLRQLVPREHPAIQLGLGAGAAMMVGIACVAGAGIPAGVWMPRLAVSCVLTGLLAPLLLMTLPSARFLGR